MLVILSVVVLFLISAPTALAVCPVCTIAVAGGVGLSRYLGIDDTIAGVWIGGLTVSMIMWTIDWLKAKKWNFKFYIPVTYLAYFAMIVVPLVWSDIIGHPLNKIWGVDKLLLGIILGSVAFYEFGSWYLVLKAKNGGKAYFPFQKVVMPIAPLIILSIIFYFITR
ncbi:MAG: hypothetical protein WCL61_01065 [bacterium]